jgi:hypothetical protein
MVRGNLEAGHCALGVSGRMLNAKVYRRDRCCVCSSQSSAFIDLPNIKQSRKPTSCFYFQAVFPSILSLFMRSPELR